MNNPKRLALTSAAVAVLCLAAQAAQAGASTKYYLRAQVIPAEFTALGNSLSSGSDATKAGYALTANGINANWATGDYTVHFVVLAFSSESQTGSVEFRILSPKKAVVYHYSWTSEQIPKGESGFTISAEADYAAPGVYFAEWLFDGNLDGWAPLNFSA